MIDVLVIGGGNAALCAALMAREAGASVKHLAKTIQGSTYVIDRRKHEEKKKRRGNL